MEAILLIGLILLNGIFAMSEIALVTARKPRLQKLADDGDRGAVAALKLSQDPTKFLSTVQIGITSIGLMNGIVGEATLAEPLAAWFLTVGMPEPAAHPVATAIVIVGVTYLSIVVGELVPKRLGQIGPEFVARRVATTMAALAAITRPFVLLLSVSTNALMRLIGVSQNARASVTEEEIHAMLAEGSEAGVIEQHEHTMVRNLFRLDDRHLGSLMVPRSEVVFLDANDPPQENLDRIIASNHSRFPVCDGGLGNPLGVVHAKQVLVDVAEGRQPDFTARLSPCVYVPETLSGMELLEQFRAEGMRIAFVVDEYGEIQGIVTAQDLVDAVTGAIEPQNDEDAMAVQRADGSWLLDGAMPIPDVKDQLGLKSTPEEAKGRYHTLSGMMLLLLGRIPKTGDFADWQGWRLEIVDMDQKRIDKVLAQPLVDSTV